MLRLLAVLLAMVIAWPHAAPARAEPRLTVGGPPTLVFDWATQRCEDGDTPDAPPRAFRDASGQVHLIATHDVNRALVGPDFAHLSHPCAVIYRGDQADDPARFDDRQWLTSFATEDGRSIFAIVHNEFHGHRRPALCPSRHYQSCWWNALTFARSDDGGRSFRQPAPPANLIATVPYAYVPDAGHPVGYFQPSNMVRKDGFTYVMFIATEYRAQRRGTCAARTADPADPAGWRGWDGTGFNVRFVDPNPRPPADPAQHVCAPVGLGRLFEMGSLGFDPASGRFLMVTNVRRGASREAGAYLSTSEDLVRWSEPVLVVGEAELDRDARGPAHAGFFALIDEASERRDFSTISARPELYLYYVEFDERHMPLGRRLLKRRVTLAR